MRRDSFPGTACANVLGASVRTQHLEEMKEEGAEQDEEGKEALPSGQKQTTTREKVKTFLFHSEYHKLRGFPEHTSSSDVSCPVSSHSSLWFYVDQSGCLRKSPLYSRLKLSQGKDNEHSFLDC